MNVDQKLQAAHEELADQYRSKRPDQKRIAQLWWYIEKLEAVL